MEGVDGEDSSNNPYVLGVVEEQDLPDVSRFIVQTFGADAIRLSSDIGAFERALMAPATELINGYSGLIAFAEVLQGLRCRLDHNIIDRNVSQYLDSPGVHDLTEPSDRSKLASRSSVVLALAKKDSRQNSQIDVIASVELRLQPCDAKIPFTLPWLDSIERSIASLVGLRRQNEERCELQPYLSNLCVDERVRGKGVGRALVRVIENIGQQWGYSYMFLHVDVDNEPAYRLYRSEGYQDVGRRWNPFWAGQARDIGYFFKTIGLASPSEQGGSRESSVRSATTR